MLSYAVPQTSLLWTAHDAQWTSIQMFQKGYMPPPVMVVRMVHFDGQSPAVAVDKGSPLMAWVQRGEFRLHIKYSMSISCAHNSLHVDDF